MSQPLVVLTYPGHFLLTALTIKSYTKFHNPKSIYVVVDDISEQSWPGYFDDCQNLYKNCKVISTTGMPVVQRFAKNPWIRQQFIKLHLDQILDVDKWFFSDGDVEFVTSAPHDATPYSIIRGGDTQIVQNAFVGKALQIDNVGIYVTHSSIDWVDTKTAQVCVSNPPFRTMKKETLKLLRDFFFQTHQKDIVQFQLDIQPHHKNFLTSEWELLANFEKNILNHDLNLVHYPTYPIDQPPEDSSTGSDYCLTCYVTDSGFDRAWWQHKQINVDDKTWFRICEIPK
jgi:hypothetical protein